jgi:hypothetical protein
VCVLWLLFACGGADPAPSSTPTEPMTDSASPSPSTPTLVTSDTAEPAPTGDTAAPVAVDCASLGLPVTPWLPGGEGWSPRSLAGDITLSTTRGPFVWSEERAGCEVLLVLPDQPAQESTWLWSAQAVEQLADALPPHVVLVVGSLTGDAAFVDDVTGWLQSTDLGDRAWVVDEPLVDAAGWLGQAMAATPWGFGVDRRQQVRYVGSFAHVEQYDEGIGWWAGRLDMAAHEVPHWDFEADRQARLDAEVGVLEVDLFTGEVVDDPSWAGQRGEVTVSLPDDLSAFDTLSADLHLGCGGEGELGYCPAWDYLVYLYVCAEGESTCSTELGRWISAYHREGRWVHDLTPLLPLLTGGETTFQFYSQQPYTVDLSLRFGTAKERPVATVPLFRGGELGPDLNDQPSVVVDVPATVSRVELATVISGHGQVGLATCAEFCELEHRFGFDGEWVELSYPLAGTERGCEDAVGDGTVPNQFGTWWFGRNGWCPGKEVPVERTDVTHLVSPGSSTTVDFEVLRNGVEVTLGGARAEVESWLVFYE